MAKEELDKMSYVRAKVLDGYEGETWPTGMIGWAEVGTNIVYDDAFTNFWFHRWEATEPRVEFETQEECVEWLENLHAYDATDLQDNVNNPAHYGQGKIECIDYIEDFLSEDEYIGYLRGNIAKYMHRWRYKGGLEDVRKAIWYSTRLELLLLKKEKET